MCIKYISSVYKFSFVVRTLPFVSVPNWLFYSVLLLFVIKSFSDEDFTPLLLPLSLVYFLNYQFRYKIKNFSYHPFSLNCINSLERVYYICRIYISYKLFKNFYQEYCLCIYFPGIENSSHRIWKWTDDWSLHYKPISRIFTDFNYFDRSNQKGRKN